ncbi:MAG: dTDP-4-dehydrorhamnose 3,5-epimerase [Miltoncostaeaceae bacterium]
MRCIDTRLPGLVLIEPTVHGDERGFFVETFRASALHEAGVREEWLQDNHSRSGRGVLRGMHFQLPPGQAKLVRCARGEVLDVAVDIRRGSPTFGQWEAFELTDRNARMIYVPVGFAHGFCVVSEVADVVYKCSNYYVADIESGFAFDDPDVGIEWPDVELIVSDRDRQAPLLDEIADDLPFVYEGAPA